MKRLLTFVIASAAALALAAPASADTYLDLQTSGAVVVSGGAYFIQGETGSAGTGVFPAFNRINETGGSGGYDGIAGTEEGYSTTANILDNTSDDTHNFSILKSQLGIVTGPDGGQYYEFHLDINEVNSGGEQYLSLDDLRLFFSATPNDTDEPFPSPATQVYQLAAGTHVLLDYSLEAGSGKADLTILIPISVLAGASSTSSVYLYSKFGVLDESCNTAPCRTGADYGQSDGFEEWSFNTANDTITVPDGGSTLGLLGLGMLTLGYARRRFGKN